MIHWYREDDTWYGWHYTSPRTESHTHEVRSPEPYVWAGWEVTSDGQVCITRDHRTSQAAREEIESLCSKF